MIITVTFHRTIKEGKPTEKQFHISELERNREHEVRFLPSLIEDKIEAENTKKNFPRSQS